MRDLRPEHLLAISGDTDCTLAEAGWTCDEDGDWSHPGEAADGVPRWDVLVYAYGYTLVREVGVYEQRWGDVTDPADLARYARAMDAADEALRASEIQTTHPDPSSAVSE